jgi:hypothetical protein
LGDGLLLERWWFFLPKNGFTSEYDLAFDEDDSKLEKDMERAVFFLKLILVFTWIQTFLLSCILACLILVVERLIW